MQQQAHVIAQRLLNVYRQEHVLIGGWPAVNRMLLDESNDPNVIAELEKLPTGKRLIKHIENLRSGKTPMDTIDPELLPYGGLMAVQTSNISLTDEELAELKFALDNFEPNTESLNDIKHLKCVQKFGNNWKEDIKAILSKDKDTLAKWENVIRTDKAYQMWDSAKELTSENFTERSRAQIQADMPEFETYLPMFGDEGQEILAKLRTYLSSNQK